MKYFITERQYRLLTEEPEEILKIPYDAFNEDWDLLQRFLERRGNPPYKLIGNLDLSGLNIKSLGNLQSVGGSLYLRYTKIKSLGNLQSVRGGLYFVNSKIKSLEKLQYVGGDLYLHNSDIQSLGNLQSVGGSLYLRNTPLSKTTTEKEIRKQVKVEGDIYL